MQQYGRLRDEQTIRSAALGVSVSGELAQRMLSASGVAVVESEAMRWRSFSERMLYDNPHVQLVKVDRQPSPVSDPGVVWFG